MARSLLWYQMIVCKCLDRLLSIGIWAGITSSMCSNAVWATALRLPSWKARGLRAPPRSESYCGRRLWRVVVCYDLSVPHWLSMSLTMCLLVHRHPPLLNWFSRMSSITIQCILAMKEWCLLWWKRWKQMPFWSFARVYDSSKYY